MLTLSRRSFVAATAISAPFLALSGKGSRASGHIMLKYANNLPLTHPLNVRAAEACARIKQETGGAVTVRIFPDNQFGGDSDMLELVRSGGIDIFTPSALVLSAAAPMAQVNALGFAFSDYVQVWAAMDGALGGFIRSAVANAGLFMLEKVWDNGFRQCTTAERPITSPADFAGLKIRVPVSPLSISMFKALSASPRGMQFSQLYGALKSKLFEAQENPLLIIESARLYEVQKYVSLTNHVWDGFFFVLNGKMWSSLPGDIQAIVSKAFNESAVAQRSDILAANAKARSSLEAKGMVFNQLDSEPFRQVLRERGFFKEWKEKFGCRAWRLLEDYVGHLV